jgi:alanyl-tRNA synthetase
MAATKLQRLQDDFEHVSKRHAEQIERLEDLTRELVRTAESLRREVASREPREGA